MKAIMLITVLLLSIFNFSQSVLESDYQLGMINSTSAKESFSYSHEFKFFSIQFTTLPIYCQTFKVFSSTGLNGQVTLGKTDMGKLYSYTGIQYVQTDLVRRKSHVNLGAGIGYKTTLSKSFAIIVQGGYNSLNIRKTDRRIVFNSEIGMSFKF